jgi:hypothetical protein
MPTFNYTIKEGTLDHDAEFKGAMAGGEPELVSFFNELPEVQNVPSEQQVDARVSTQDDPNNVVWARTWDAP